MPSTIARPFVWLIISPARSIKGIRIALKVCEATALGQNAHNAPAGEVRPVLEIGQQIGKRYITFLNGDRRPCTGGFVRQNTVMTDGNIGLAVDDAHLRDWWPSRNRLGEIRYVNREETAPGIAPSFPSRNIVAHAYATGRSSAGRAT